MLGSSVFDSQCRNMWLEVKAGPKSFRKKGKTDNANAADCFHMREARGSVTELKNTAEEMSKGGFTLWGIVASLYGDISKTHAASNSTSSSSLIREYEGKNSTVKPNTSFPSLSADNLKTSPGQCKHPA